MQTLVLTLLLFSTNPNDSLLVSNSEFLTINHLYNDETGAYRLTQFLFKEYNPYDNTYDIIDWRLVETTANGQIIKYNIYQYGDRKILMFWDGSKLRKIYIDEYKETWTQHDEEVEDLQKHGGREHRKGLPTGQKLTNQKKSPIALDNP